ncbi:MAG: hypothetical protein JNJ54_20325 [Myxococcaceae bacterium]|nr:hypothetical protein [Myxococcaceae bacterium]
MLATALLLLSTATTVSPCIDEVTVRDAPTVTAKRLGALSRGVEVELLRTSDARDTLTLTIDRNVPAPFRVKLEDWWLEVALPADAGAARGWVFGGVMCRQAFPPKERWLTVLGWSADGTKVAFIEKATDSFACGWGRPATLRVIDVVTGAQLDSLSDGCPAADLFLSRRAELEAVLSRHEVRPEWTSTTATEPLKAELARCRRGACVARLRDPRGVLRAEAPLEPPDADVPGARAEVVLLASRSGARVAFVRVQWNEETHRFFAIRLSDTRGASSSRMSDGPVSPGVSNLKSPDDLPGVRFTSTDPMCGTLAATTKDEAAAKALATLEGELRRRMKRFFGSEGVCLLGKSREGTALVLDLVGDACVGNECPAGPCKTKLEFTIGPDFTVRQERKLRYEGWSCSP